MDPDVLKFFLVLQGRCAAAAMRRLPEIVREPEAAFHTVSEKNYEIFRSFFTVCYRKVYLPEEPKPFSPREVVSLSNSSLLISLKSAL